MLLEFNNVSNILSTDDEEHRNYSVFLEKSRSHSVVGKLWKISNEKFF